MINPFKPKEFTPTPQKNPSVNWYILFSVIIVFSGVILMALTLPDSSVFDIKPVSSVVQRFDYVDRTPSGVCPTGTAVFNTTSCLKVNTPVPS